MNQGTREPQRNATQGASAAASAFTLIELLVVLAIMGILASLALPSIKNMNRSSGMASATQQLLDDVALARRLAIQNRTTVLMVFLPPDVAAVGAFGGLDDDEKNILLRGRLTSYALVSMRQVGDQPGQSTPRYLKPWTELPDGFLIPEWKFTTGAGFDAGSPIPFSDAFLYADVKVPTINSPRAVNIAMPYIAFGPEGRLQKHIAGETFGNLGRNEILPLARGSIFMERNINPGGKEVFAAIAPDVSERPAGNSTNNYHLVVIDHLTGRGRLVRPEIQ